MSLTVDEIQQKKKEYEAQRVEFDIKDKMGMPMSLEERELYEKIDGLITQCEWIVEWMIMEGEDTYEWTF